MHILGQQGSTCARQPLKRHAGGLSIAIENYHAGMHVFQTLILPRSFEPEIHDDFHHNTIDIHVSMDVN
jgi:hypothetical protein